MTDASSAYALSLRQEIRAVLLRDFTGWQMGSAPDDLVEIAERYIAQATDLGYSLGREHGILIGTLRD